MMYLATVELLANLQWTSLETRRINSKLLCVYKIINGHTAPNLRNKFRFNYDFQIKISARGALITVLQSRCKNHMSNRLNFTVLYLCPCSLVLCKVLLYVIDLIL